LHFTSYFSYTFSFYPEEAVRSAITTIFKENFGGPWSCWKDAKEKQKVPLLWFNDFKVFL